MKAVAIRDKRKPSSQIVIRLFVYYLVWFREMIQFKTKPIQSDPMVDQHMRNMHENGIMTINDKKNLVK